jgi:putative transposase
LTAGIFDCAEDYRWGSLWNWCGGDSDIKLSAWPVKRLRRWIDRVNEPIAKKEHCCLKTKFFVLKLTIIKAVADIYDMRSS